MATALKIDGDKEEKETYERSALIHCQAIDSFAGSGDEFNQANGKKVMTQFPLHTFINS